MKNKEPFIRKLVRFYYSIKGWRMTRKMRVGDYYVSEYIKDSRLMYRGKRTFYVAYANQPYPGVIFFDQKKKQYKFWEIGVLNFRRG